MKRNRLHAHSECNRLFVHRHACFILLWVGCKLGTQAIGVLSAVVHPARIQNYQYGPVPSRARAREEIERQKTAAFPLSQL